MLYVLLAHEMWRERSRKSSITEKRQTRRNMEKLKKIENE